MKIIKGLLVLALFFILVSCEALLLSTYGIKKSKLYSLEEIAAHEQKFDIPQEASYRLDTTYIDLIEKEVKDPKIQDYHYQPLQVFYFDKKDSLVSYYVNCNTGGFPNLKWNVVDEEKKKSLSYFPPISQTPINTPLTYKKLLSVFQKTKHTQKPKEADYKVVVFWNVQMGRQSRRLIRTIKKNIALHPNEVCVYYVNNDAMYG